MVGLSDQGLQKPTITVSICLWEMSEIACDVLFVWAELAVTKLLFFWAELAVIKASGAALSSAWKSRLG